MSPILRMHKVRNERLAAEGLEFHIAAARVPMTVVSPAGGYHTADDGRCDDTGKGVVNPLHDDHDNHPWVTPQFDPFRRSESVLLPDDMAEVFPKEQHETIVRPPFKRIFDEFDGVTRVHHIDTPFVRERRFAWHSAQKQQLIGAGGVRGIRPPENKREHRRR
jgi:hypothetical protein